MTINNVNMHADSFSDAVKTYVQLHDELGASSKHMTALRKKQAELAEAILAHMKAEGVDECVLPDATKIVRKQSRRVQSLKKDDILKALKTLSGDETRAQAFLENIYNNRDVVVTDALQRVK